MPEELIILSRWTEFLKWLLNTTDKFPKKTRFTFASRIDNLALDILEDIIECKYHKRARESGLRSINIKLEKLRILLRICYDMRYISMKQYEHSAVNINEIGKMAHGWLNGDVDP